MDREETAGKKHGMFIAGIDPGLTCTSIVHTVDGAAPTPVDVTSKPQKALMSRINKIADAVHAIVRNCHLICIEVPFVHPQHTAAVIPLLYLHHEIRRRLLANPTYRARQIYEVAPTALKKFVTGKGNAPKDAMMMHAFKRWGFTAATNHQADAFGLAMIAAALAGRPQDCTAAMMDVVEKTREKGEVR